MSFVEDYLRVKPTGIALTAGRILISVPFFNDPFFNRTVVLLTDFDAHNRAGLVLNKQTGYPVNKIVSGVKVDAPMYIGGPVMINDVFCVHNHANHKNAHKLLPGIYLGYDELFLAIIEHEAIKTIRYKFMIGYSGWSSGQLEEEIENKMWIVANANPELVFDTPADEVWRTAVKQLGKDYQHWLELPKEISEN